MTATLFTRPWDTFFDERVRRMCKKEAHILDIGAGLRLSKVHGNREAAAHRWIAELIARQGIHYEVLDYVDTYHPDIVGDIQALPLKDASQEHIVCLAVLEHVENPFKSFAELYRVLKEGGDCLLYVPFLYYYHAERGYYGDYWRFTKDSLRSLSKKFSTTEIQSVRGPLETLVRLSPLGRRKWCANVVFLCDKLFGKLSSAQTSGYYVWLVK